MENEIIYMYTCIHISTWGGIMLATRRAHGSCLVLVLTCFSKIHFGISVHHLSFLWVNPYILLHPWFSYVFILLVLEGIEDLEIGRTILKTVLRKYIYGYMGSTKPKDLLLRACAYACVYPCIAQNSCLREDGISL